jgi:hypothetical protein
VFENIKSLRPYFFSLREIENNVSLDIKIPLTWKYDEIIKPYRILNIKVQDKNDKYTLLSLISSATQNGYDVALACANEIIKLNKEEEEKQKLFQEKVKELQELFKKQSLDKLKDINLLNLDGQEDTTSIGLVEEGDGERSEGGGDTQESDD